MAYPETKRCEMAEDRPVYAASLGQLFREISLSGVQEATATVEEELRLEDSGWTNLSNQLVVVTDAERKTNITTSRTYALKDPLGKQSIRLWTDYAFGPGMTWSVPDDAKSTKAALDAFWNAKVNKKVLGAVGQRLCSNKLLIDGEMFFAIFLGKESTIRYIDPLEITEIITNPNDAMDVRYYKREWSTPQGNTESGYYCSIANSKDESCKDAAGKDITKTQDALIYHLAINTISQRGNPLLLPALDWITQYRRFLASRVAIMLALARFAWQTKVVGGQAQVNAIKAKTDDVEVPAGSHLVENLGSMTTPIKTDTGASNAWQDGRMIKLQVCAAVGIPEQYFGDISTGSLATAQTVELPMLKMLQSYQVIWKSAYSDINDVILEHADVPESDWYVDMDFAPIAPEDALAMADALVKVIGAFPELGESKDVKQQALVALGINDTAAVLEELKKLPEGSQEAATIRVLKRLEEALSRGDKA